MYVAEVKLYRKLPVEIQAVQYGGWSSFVNCIQPWAQGSGADIYYVGTGYEHSLRKENEKDRGNGHILDNAPDFLVIFTLEGQMRCDRGDWIIRGVKGEFYPCKPDIFKQTYEEVKDG